MKTSRFLFLAFAITLITIVAQMAYADQCTWWSCKYHASDQHYHYYYAPVYCGYMGHGLYLGDRLVWYKDINASACDESESSYLSPQSGDCGQHVGWNPGSGNPGYTSTGIRPRLENIEGSLPSPDKPGIEMPSPDKPGIEMPSPEHTKTLPVRKDVWLDGWDLWYYGNPTPRKELPEDLKFRIENEVGVNV